MGSTCTVITVGKPAPVCTGSTPCADGSARECRDDGFYWDCVDGCWRNTATSCRVDPCTIDPCGSTCTDCFKCPSLAICDPCVTDPCGEECDDCSKCPTKPSCQDKCIANPCQPGCDSYSDCKVCPDSPQCKTTPIIVTTDPCETDPCLSICPDALRAAYKCDAEPDSELPPTTTPPTPPTIIPGVGTEGNISECDGFNRDGQFDMSCAMEGDNKYLVLFGGLALIGGIVLLSRRS